VSTEIRAAEKLETQEVVAWRFHELFEAGYSWDCAARIAVDRKIDLHVALELLARGCPEPTALRILA
jgi:hypothetical protein